MQWRPSFLPACLLAFALAASILTLTPDGAGASTSRAARSAAAPRLVVGMGDSVMYGMHCHCAGIPAMVARAEASRTGTSVTSRNLAWPGGDSERLRQALWSSQEFEEGAAGAWRILVIVGANDFGDVIHTANSGAACPQSCWQHDVTNLGQEMGRILRRINQLRRAGSQVLVGTYWDVSFDGQQALDRWGGTRIAWNRKVTRAANAALCLAARHHRATCVDTYTPLITDTGGDPTPYLAADSEHTNARGTRLIARQFIAASRP